MIKLSGVSRRFQLGEQWVNGLQSVDLNIPKGQYLSVMGPSGSGKSTLLNIIGLLDRPDRGHYFLNDRDTACLNDKALAELRSNTIGFVFQSFHLVSRLTAFENIELPLMLVGMAPVKRRQIVERLMEQLGLTERAHHAPHQLSGGQRQRVAIARAMAHSPSVLLADEPTGNLDSQSGREVVELLESLNQQQGLTLILVTHDSQLGHRAPRVLQMADGAIIQDTLPHSRHFAKEECSGEPCA